MHDKGLVDKGALITANFTGGTTGATIVAAVAGKKIRLIAMMLTTDTAGNVTVRDNTDTPIKLVGAMPVAANGGFVLPFNGRGWGDTGAGKQLDVLLSASCTTFGGVVQYQILSTE